MNGEEEVDFEKSVFLKARVLKQANGYHKMVYAETTQQVNSLIEFMLTKNSQNAAKDAPKDAQKGGQASK